MTQLPDATPGTAQARSRDLPVDKYVDYLRQRQERERAMASEPPATTAYLKDVILKDLDSRSDTPGGWSVEGPLAKGRDSWVFKACTPVTPWPLAVKVHCSAIPAKLVVKRYRLLQHYHAAMAGGRFTVPTPWAILPEHRTLVSEWIDDPLAGTLLRQVGRDRQRRAEVFEAAGQWLGRFHRQAGVDLAAIDAVRLQWHVDRSLGANAGAGYAVDDPVFRHGYAVLVRRADEFDQTPVGHTTCHGDFTPTNLFHGPERTVGFDFQVFRGLPVSFDICRYLVYAETSKPFATRKAELSQQGTERRDQEAFMAGYGGQPLEGRILSYLHLAEVLRRWASLIGTRPGDRFSPAHWVRLYRLRRMAACAARHLDQEHP